MTKIWIVKHDHTGAEKFRYETILREKDATRMVVDARFRGEDVNVEGIVFQDGDKFIETYYRDRWYNIYEIRAREHDQLKGWYCNICHPALFEQDRISFHDLLLDLLVYPDGKQLVLDEDEFAAAAIEQDVRVKALSGLTELQNLFTGKKVLITPN